MNADQQFGPDLTVSDDGRRFLYWWDAARTDHRPPRRGDLAIDAVRDQLSRITVIDALGPDRMILRLTGTEIDQHAGVNPTGFNVLDITPPEDRGLRAARLWAMASQPCIGAFWFQGGTATRNESPVEGFTVPVRPSGDGPMQFFSMFRRYRASIERGQDRSNLTHVMPRHFRYVDFGCGTPGDDTGAGITLSHLLALPGPAF